MRLGWRGVVGCAYFFVCTGATHASSLPTSPSILIEATTGRVLVANRADQAVPVGTLGQAMVAFLALEQANFGVLPLDVPVTVGPSAAIDSQSGQQGRIALQGDRAYILSELIKAILVAAPENAAVAVGEAISGTVANCVETMNARASLLGMRDTRFEGLPAERSGTTTARDLARLGRVLTKDPSVLRWASASGIPFDETNTVLRNRNRLIGAFPGADGLATSDGNGSYSIIATAERESFRLIAVVASADTSEARYEAAFELLEWGFANFGKLDVVRQGEHLNVSVGVENGAISRINPIAGESLSLVRRRRDTARILLRYQVATSVTAPLRREQPVGEVIVEEDGRIVGVVPAIVPTDVAAAGLLAAAER